MKKAGADLAKLSVEALKKRERAAMEELSRGLSANNFARFKPLPFQQHWYESDAKVRALVGGARIGKSTYASSPSSLAALARGQSRSAARSQPAGHATR